MSQTVSSFTKQVFFAWWDLGLSIGHFIIPTPNWRTHISSEGLKSPTTLKLALKFSKSENPWRFRIVDFPAVFFLTWG